MSRSIRNKHDKYGVNLKMCSDSNKKDKRLANRKFRRIEAKEARETLIQEEDKFTVNDINEVSNTWDFSSDGLAYYVKLNDTKRFSGPIPENKKYKFKNK